MSAWVDRYVEEMGELRFSEEEKDRIAARLVSSLADARADVIPFEGPTGTEVQTLGGTDEADGVADSDEVGEKDDERDAAASPAPFLRWRRRHALVRVAATVLLAFGIAGVSGYAYASGALGVGVGVVRDVFTGPPASTEVYNSVGYLIGASETCDGVTVTAEAVMGDASNYMVVFSVRREDGRPFEGVSENDGGTLNLLFTNGGTLRIDGIRSSGGRSFFLAGDAASAGEAESDADGGSYTTIYYVYQGSVETADSGSIIGRTARVELSDLRMTDESGTPAGLVASGTWEFKFSMGYGDESLEVEGARGAEVSFDDVTATVESLQVSPLGVTLDLTSGDDALDVRDVPLAVTFADGTTCVLDDTAFVSAEWGWGVARVRKSGFFGRVSSVDDIVSVTVGTTVFPVRG